MDERRYAVLVALFVGLGCSRESQVAFVPEQPESITLGAVIDDTGSIVDTFAVGPGRLEPTRVRIPSDAYAVLWSAPSTRLMNASGGVLSAAAVAQLSLIPAEISAPGCARCGRPPLSNEVHLREGDACPIPMDWARTIIGDPAPPEPSIPDLRLALGTPDCTESLSNPRLSEVRVCPGLPAIGAIEPDHFAVSDQGSMMGASGAFEFMVAADGEVLERKTPSVERRASAVQALEGGTAFVVVTRVANPNATGHRYAIVTRDARIAFELPDVFEPFGSARLDGPDSVTLLGSDRGRPGATRCSFVAGAVGECRSQQVASSCDFSDHLRFAVALENGAASATTDNGLAWRTTFDSSWECLPEETTSAVRFPEYNGAFQRTAFASIGRAGNAALICANGTVDGRWGAGLIALRGALANPEIVPLLFQPGRSCGGVLNARHSGETTAVFLNPSGAALVSEDLSLQWCAWGVCADPGRLGGLEVGAEYAVQNGGFEAVIAQSGTVYVRRDDAPFERRYGPANPKRVRRAVTPFEGADGMAFPDSSPPERVMVSSTTCGQIDVAELPPATWTHEVLDREGMLRTSTSTSYPSMGVSIYLSTADRTKSRIFQVGLGENLPVLLRRVDFDEQTVFDRHLGSWGEFTPRAVTDFDATSFVFATARDLMIVDKETLETSTPRIKMRDPQTDLQYPEPESVPSYSFAVTGRDVAWIGGDQRLIRIVASADGPVLEGFWFGRLVQDEFPEAELLSAKAYADDQLVVAAVFQGGLRRTHTLWRISSAEDCPMVSGPTPASLRRCDVSEFETSSGAAADRFETPIAVFGPFAQPIVSYSGDGTVYQTAAVRHASPVLHPVRGVEFDNSAILQNQGQAAHAVFGR